MVLILASTSPRRKELLALLGVPFDIAEPDFIEQIRPGTDPEQQARCFADCKARSCAEHFPEALVLGSDTLISVDSDILGKPADARESAWMLRRLRGRDHTVHTAVALRRQADGIADIAVETARVWMRDFSDSEAEAYLRSGEGLGKAGAYSIQGLGGTLIAAIEGDYTAVVGLPVRIVATLLQRRGLRLPIDVDELYRKRPYPNWDRFATGS